MQGNTHAHTRMLKEKSKKSKKNTHTNIHTVPNEIVSYTQFARATRNFRLMGAAPNRLQYVWMYSKNTVYFLFAHLFICRRLSLFLYVYVCVCALALAPRSCTKHSNEKNVQLLLWLLLLVVFAIHKSFRSFSIDVNVEEYFLGFQWGIET